MCSLNIDKRIQVLSQWGQAIQQFDTNILLKSAMEQEHIYHQWSVFPFLQRAMIEYSQILNQDFLHEYINTYEDKIQQHIPQRIGVILQENFPLSGMELLLPILLVGDVIISTPFADKRNLLNVIVKQLETISPNIGGQICLQESRMVAVQKMIVPQKYTESIIYTTYFKNKYPTYVQDETYSVAVLTGNETEEQLSLLADDILSYFGMAQGAVKMIFVPQNYDFHALFMAINKYHSIVGMHNKYLNNLEYQKTLHLFHSIPFLDQGLMFVRPQNSLIAPISVLNYQHYNSLSQVATQIAQLHNKVDKLISIENANFGTANHFKYNLLNSRDKVLSFLLNSGSKNEMQI